MFELAILDIIYNMATSNINKMSKYNKKAIAILFKTTSLIEQCYRHFSGIAIFLKKLTLFHP